jgi:hypothetical protein
MYIFGLLPGSLRMVLLGGLADERYDLILESNFAGCPAAAGRSRARCPSMSVQLPAWALRPQVDRDYLTEEDSGCAELPNDTNGHRSSRLSASQLGAVLFYRATSKRTLQRATTAGSSTPEKPNPFQR